MPFLTVRTHDGGIFRFELVSSTVRIGRSQDNDLVLDDPTVSRLHALVKLRSDRHYVIDLGSRGGTFVNGRPVKEPTPVEEGDAISLGRTKLTFDSWSAPAVELDDSVPSEGSKTTRISVDEVSLGDYSSPPAEPLREPDLVAFLAEVDAELAVHRPLMELYQRIIEVAGRAIPFERAIVMTRENGELVPQAQHTTGRASSIPISFSRSLADEAVRERRAILVSDPGESIRSAMCAPLWNGRDVEGIVYVDCVTRSRPFSDKNLQLLTHLAGLVAIKIENKRLFEESVKAKLVLEELRHAAEIQNQFLPGSAPDIAGYRLHGFNRPSSGVGGDFFNYFAFEDGRYGNFLGDVAGNGLPAALLMCSFQPLVRAVMDGSDAPDQAMGRLNRLLCEQIPVNRFITAFLGILDPREHLLSFANAGQNSPLLVEPDGSVSRLAGTGFPLGIMSDASYQADRAALGPGSTLLIYSDGLTELADAGGDEFGERRLEQAARNARDLPPERVVAHLVRGAEAHAGDDANEDDITVVVLQRHG